MRKRSIYLFIYLMISQILNLILQEKDFMIILLLWEDFLTLMRSLSSYQERNSQIHNNLTNYLNLSDLKDLNFVSIKKINSSHEKVLIILCFL